MSYASRADLGGQLGHGRVVPEDEDVRFHAKWERDALAVVLAMGATGSWNIDMSRAARETLPEYLQLSYYEIWLAALEKLMLERRLLTPGELQAGRMLAPAAPVPRVLHAAQVNAALAKGSPTLRAASALPRFAPGQRVRTRAEAVPHHTRLPGYARGKTGTIARWHGSHVFADSNARGLGEAPQHLYTVVFDARELWGPEAAPGVRVSVDAWEPYLDPA